ncbi:MAG: exopolysaccharide biosynthesis polyprenyl glycosylphosphotransferase [Verrucomicrobia bacterium]|nr:exopolysaccharide biosynthesis polyprenyl glycosylphosphotransferase [Verrucomicrobiota bacterium]
MFTYRQRGLVSLHAILTCGIITAFLPVYALLLPYLPRIRLQDQINLLPYCVAAFLAMIASAGAIREVSNRLFSLGSVSSLSLAARQIFYVAAAIFAVVFSSKDQAISRLFLGSYLFISFVLLAYLHARLPSALASLLFPQRAQLPTLFVGQGKSLEDLDSWISSRGHVGIAPIGFLSDELPSRGELAIAPYLGDINQLENVLKDHSVAQVILLDWNLRNEEIEHIVEHCEQEGVRFLIHNNYTARFAREMTPVEEGGRHFLSLQTEPLEDPVNRGLKRLLDIAVSLPVCVFALPPLVLIIWTMQRIQAPGPLCFNRPRGGRGRKPFTMYKFRSMYEANHNINIQASAGDARVFPFGKLMRKMSLDEFPQFLNVLKGEMSVVGPRPHLPKHDLEFSKITRTYHGRSFVKPGITGLAQIYGYRGEITEPHKLHRRVYWDLYYVARWSLWMDIRIILRTAWQIFFPPTTAY